VTTTETMTTTTHGPPGATARRGVARSDTSDLSRRLERHRGELTAFCFARLGSWSEAEDAAQETMIRAWRGHDGFRGQSSLRTWLYCIAANACIDLRRSPQRRALAIDLGPARAADPAVGSSPPSTPWIAPFRAASAPPPAGETGDPAEAVATRDEVRRAFATLLLDLPSRQRAVLVLCEVLRWRATEVAELLGTTVASVTSALQRARSTLAGAERAASGRAGEGRAGEGAAGETPVGRVTAERDIPDDLIARVIDAFECSDVDSLVSLLR
jgi:RNA polymerase sigma-70 factor (ECF subfamily)